MSDSPATQNPSTAELSSRLKATLAEIRSLLLLRPTELSLVTTGPRLEQVASDLSALATAVPPPSRHDLLEIQALSASVQSLYRGAFTFFTGLASETMERSASTAVSYSSYSSAGEWQASAAEPAPRLILKG